MVSNMTSSPDAQEKESSRKAEKHIAFLDPIRGAAILSVFLFHAFGATFHTLDLKWLGTLRDWNVSASFLALLPVTLGWMGVAIFFVVSGFCIHLSHERSRQKSFKVFFIRRFFRIYPPYLLALCFFAFVYPPTRLDFSSALMHTHTAFTYSCVTTSAHLLLIHNFFGYFNKSINGSFWSIAVEVQLYALYPLLLWLVSHLGWKSTLYLTALIEFSLRGLQGILSVFLPEVSLTGWFDESPLIFWYSWSVGAVLADAYLKNGPLPFQKTPLLLWPVLAVSCNFWKPLFPFCFTLAALSIAVVISRFLTRPSPTLPQGGIQGLLIRHLAWVGTISYSAYLLHQPLVEQMPALLHRFLPTESIPSLVCYGFSILAWFPILALSYVFYRWIELPSIAWGKRIVDN